jgi:hypothetical protein
MLRTLIDIERKRFKDRGYDIEVSADEYTVFGNVETIQLGNDVAILTGFTFDSDSVAGGDDPRISVTSPTDSLSGHVSQLSDFGKNTYKVMRQYMNVARLGGSTAYYDIPPMTIQFVRISPISKQE